MASKCFYLILHSTLFIVTVFIAQVLSDSAGHHYLVNHDAQNFDTIFVPLVRERRQVFQNDKKPEVPIEDKSKLTKKPTDLDVKSTSFTLPDSEKPKLGVNKKEFPYVKTLNLSVLQSDPHDFSQPPDISHHSQSEHDPLPHPSPEPGEVHAQKNSSLNISATSTPSSSTVNTTGATVMTTTIKPLAKDSSSVSTNTSSSGPDIQITKMFDMNFNKVLREHNITLKEDTHLYYNSSFVVDPELGQKYWVDLNKHSDSKVSDVLSQAYRRAMTVKLSFDFPFYGHMIRNITIATGGFLYTGEYVHAWLAATQYIAPLMANFDTTLSNNSFVKYRDNGTAFTVQWENVILQEKPDKGGFTFQCTLHKNGDIVFVYQQVAVVIEDIEDDQHPVKVGLSDAYIIDRTIFFVRRKTIYEYHKLSFKKQDIKNWTVIVLNALDTCLDMKDCHSCLTQLKSFRCNWCGDRCSDGMDRHRQDWIARGCDKTKLKPLDECAKEDIEEVLSARSSAVVRLKPQLRSRYNLSGDNTGLMSQIDSQVSQTDRIKNQLWAEKEKGFGKAGIIGILFIVCLALGVGIWLFYAYRNPHTPAGQFLIRYRPSEWSWRRGEARYTAATIHM